MALWRSEHPPSPIMSFWIQDRRKWRCTLSSETPEITPSSDFWIADSTCNDNCDGINTFNPSQSSSFTNETTPFSIKYGSGDAQGYLGKDVVQLAGFSVSDQVFGRCFSSSAPRNSSEAIPFQLCAIPSQMVFSRPQSPA